MTDFERYITAHAIRKNTIGKSGADVYELENGRIAKHVCRDKLADSSLWDSYVRECQFYSSHTSKGCHFLPEIYHCCGSEDEIQIIMKKYRPLHWQDGKEEMLERVFAVLGEIHNLPIPSFLRKKKAESPYYDPNTLAQCLEGWQSVVEEHGQVFSQEDLYRVWENINALNKSLYSPREWCCHGDFHMENLLEAEDGRILVCDWQSVGPGHAAGDISFFLSRLAADGCRISKERAVKTYCRLSSTDVAEKEISVQMSLANLNTSFVFWHCYLHGSSQKRVWEIFSPMVEDLDFLLGAGGFH